MIDETRRPDSETDLEEPVFASEEEGSPESQTESSSDGTPDSTSLPEPGAPAEPLAETRIETEVDVPGIDEPVFASGAEPEETYEIGQQQESPESDYEPPEVEFTASAPEFEAWNSEESFEGSFDGQDDDRQDSPVAGTDWVNVAPDSESTEEARLETEYNFFDETPAAEVAAVPPPTRKLGRTGPVWVLGGIALVLIAGVVWLGISRLTGSEDIVTEPPSEPSVQQVAAEEPTPAPPTNTPGPDPTPTPILLPVNANVTVVETDGQGVKLRSEPGLAGTLVEIIAEGTTMVVLEDDPDSQYAEYPVPSDGYLWYRMRVTGMVDGEGNPLIGWSASEFFVVDVP